MYLPKALFIYTNIEGNHRHSGDGYHKYISKYTQQPEPHHQKYCPWRHFSNYTRVYISHRKRHVYNLMIVTWSVLIHFQYRATDYWDVTRHTKMSNEGPDQCKASAGGTRTNSIRFNVPRITQWRNRILTSRCLTPRKYISNALPRKLSYAYGGYHTAYGGYHTTYGGYHTTYGGYHTTYGGYHTTYGGYHTTYEGYHGVWCVTLLHVYDAHTFKHDAHTFKHDAHTFKHDTHTQNVVLTEGAPRHVPSSILPQLGVRACSQQLFRKNNLLVYGSIRRLATKQLTVIILGTLLILH